MKCFKHVRYSIRIVAMLLLVATFSSIHGFPVFAIETENISDELMELKRATDPNTPIDNVFIELAIDKTDYMMAKTKEGITVSELNKQIESFDETSTYEEVKSVIMAKRRALCDYLEQRNTKVVKALGIENSTTYISSLNIIMGSYTPAQIERISANNNIKYIGRDDPNATIVSDIADEDVHVRTANIRNAGYTGNGIKIGVIEKARNITGTTGTSHVTSVAVPGEPSSDLAGASGVTHALRVVGILRKVAPGAHIYITRISETPDSNTPMRQLMDSAYSLAYTYEVDVLNISQGQTSEEYLGSSAATYLNSLVRNLNLTICCACGNPDTTYNPGRLVSLLAASENVIGVGAAKWVGGSDPYVVADGYACADRAGAVNKPDFCSSAFGISIPDYNVSAANGTSFSTPIVSGTVALLMEKNAYLIGRQSLVKALLSAGAKYKGTTNYITTNNRCFSYLEGTGVIDSYCAYSTLSQSRYATKTISQSDEGSSYSKNFSVTSSDNVIRVTLSWLKKTNLSNFDLYVYKGSTLVAKDTGGIQTLRAVEFNPSAYGYGTYTIKIVYESLNNSTDSFSVAWY